MKLNKKQRSIVKGQLCPYCGSQTETVPQKKIYGRTYGKGRDIIACKNYPSCDSYVGTHDDGTALGRLADRKLRKAKKAAHFYFDPIWKEKHMSRNKAYHALADHLKIPKKYCHIGYFGINTCNVVIGWSTKFINELKNENNA